MQLVAGLLSAQDLSRLEEFVNRIERNGATYPTWLDTDSHLFDVVDQRDGQQWSIKSALADELAWWTRCVIVVAATGALGFFCGWLLSKVL